MRTKTAVLAALGLALAALAGPGVSLAQTSADKAVVDAGKASGTVGEQSDGYLGIVSGGDAATHAAVAHINEGRAKAYAGIAAKTGVTVQQAGEATAVQLIAKLPAGAYYRNASGAWVRK